MKVTGWTWWDNPEYAEMFPLEDRMDPSWDMYDKVGEIEKLIAEDIRKHGYKFTGSYHQGGDYGAPIIDDKWLYQCSCRSWGNIIVMAYPEEFDSSDRYAYTVWAWLPPGYPDNPERMIVPEKTKD